MMQYHHQGCIAKDFCKRICQQIQILILKILAKHYMKYRRAQVGYQYTAGSVQTSCI